VEALSNSPVKRKASEVSDDDNTENIAPSLFSKRSKGADLWGDLGKSFYKPPAFTLTKAVSSPPVRDVLTSAPTGLSSARPRSVLQPKSPAARLLKARNAAPAPLTAPAGRSPTRASKRVGILSRRRIQRSDPPSRGLGAGVPFSLDAALKGTIPGYSGSLRSTPRSSSKASKTTTTSSTSSNAAVDFFLPTPDMASSWCFDIHEDTPEQEMTNLLQHGTCTLDISSDEESESCASRDRAEGRDKENIPPPEDVSQTSSARGAAASAVDIDEDVVLLKGRGPLAEMNAADFYGEGCDGSSVFIVPGDEEDPEAVVDEGALVAAAASELSPLPPSDDGEQLLLEEAAGAPEPQPQQHGVSLGEIEAVDIDHIMRANDPSVDAAMLAPIEDPGESFELWESNSAKDEGDAPASPAPAAGDDLAQQAPLDVL
jgi:hypothetical protein